MNRIRRLRRRLTALADATVPSHASLTEMTRTAILQLSAIEGALVDVKRESPRDVLRHAAGLDDTLIDCINTVAISDLAPTAQADAVSRETMAKVSVELAKLGALVAREIAEINGTAARLGIAHVSG